MKVAIDGRWEEALVASLAELPLSKATLRAFLGDADDVAFEVFFSDRSTGICYLGVRLARRTTDDRTSIIAGCSRDSPDRCTTQ